MCTWPSFWFSHWTYRVSFSSCLAPLWSELWAQNCSVFKHCLFPLFTSLLSLAYAHIPTHSQPLSFLLIFLLLKPCTFVHGQISGLAEWKKEFLFHVELHLTCNHSEITITLMQFWLWKVSVCFLAPSWLQSWTLYMGKNKSEPSMKITLYTFLWRNS